MLESLANIGENAVFSQIDLRNGFNQIPLDNKSRDLTTFILGNRQYRYKRMPFGLKLGPRLFQKVIIQILGDIENCFVYIDVIVIFAKNKSIHDEVLKDVIERLSKWNVEINFEKSKVYLNGINVLGFNVSSKGIEPDIKGLKNKIFEEKICTKKQLQILIGVLNWYRPFIKDLSSKLAEVTELLKQEKFKFTEQHKETIEIIRKELIDKYILSFPNYDKPFKMECDASDHGIGSVLYQEHGVIGYFSKKTYLKRTKLLESRKRILFDHPRRPSF